MRWIVQALLGCLAVTLGTSGCGGGPACETTFAACGGDLTGAWTYQKVCNPGSNMSSTCPTAVVNVDTNVSGTVTFDTNNTYTSDATIAETGSETIPASCLGGVITSCSELDESSTTGGLTLKVTCTGDATTSCSCDVSLSGTTSITGTYATAGDDVVLTPKGGTASSPTGYCVSGGALELAGGITGSGMASTYSLFTK
jgi:hypothetical protein